MVYFKTSGSVIKMQVMDRQNKNKNTARCTVCQKETDLLTMGDTELDSHAFSKKHTTK